MKFNIGKAILAAAFAAVLAIGSVNAAAAGAEAASEESTQQEYNIIVDTTFADVTVEVWDSTVSDIIIKSKAKAGEMVFVSATAKPAYSIIKINHSGGGVSGHILGTKGGFRMPEGDVTITVDVANSFRVSPHAGDHVTVSISVTGNNKYGFAHYGDSVSVTATPDSGYILTKLEVKTYGDDTVIASFSGNSGTFSMPAKPVIVVAEAEPATPTTPTTPTEPTTPTTPTEPTTPTTPTVPTTPTEPTKPTTPTEPITPQYKKGDVNGDERVNAADATLILKHAVELITLNDEQLDRADVNGDGRVNAADATLILKMAVGLA
ncbi:MAG: hypothetical protein K2N06_00855 [Oscillospiraceae bacterium]|nr:hypothetical protein [Oscillospiraceae bacterium]